MSFRKAILTVTNGRIINAGLVEPGLPKRRYKYQLLDPLDEPYAIFRFYYRSYGT